MVPKSIRLISFIVVILALAGCTMPNATVPEPTFDMNIVAQTVAAVQTEAVLEAYSQMTQTAAAMPTATATLVPTETTVPTATDTATPIPTATFPPVPTATFIPATLAPTLTFTPSAYQCTVTALNPASGAKIRRGGDFDLNVTLRNSGTTTWDTNDVDFHYVSGAKFQESVSALDLPRNIAVGETVNFIVDMIATNDTGRQTAVWGLTRSGSNFCTFTVAIQVTE